MSSIAGAIANYQEVNSFYAQNSLRSELFARFPYDKFAQVEPDEISADDNAAVASISPEAIALYNAEQKSDTKENGTPDNTDKELTPQEEQEVAELKTTDAEVRAHEQAHKAAAGGLRTSAPNYEYETGPDGKKYAVAGDVNVSYQHSSDPEVNLKNALQLKASALAPAEPSSQDRKVAAQADREIAEARQEIQKEQKQAEENEENSSDINAASVEPETAAESNKDYSSMELSPEL